MVGAVEEAVAEVAVVVEVQDMAAATVMLIPIHRMSSDKRSLGGVKGGVLYIYIYNFKFRLGLISILYHL